MWLMNPLVIGGLVVSSFLSMLGVVKLEKKQTLVSPVVLVAPTITTMPTIEIEVTPVATKEATISAAPKKPKPTPTKEPFETVSHLIDQYSALYGLDVNVIRYLALCESGLRSNATNGKYVGIFQYDERTWKTLRQEMNLETNPDLRYSAEEAIKTTAYAISKGKTKLWPNCVP